MKYGAGVHESGSPAPVYLQNHSSNDIFFF